MENQQASVCGEDVTILLLGTTSLTPDLPDKLEALGADVERAGVRHAAAAVVAVAPDLVVLLGDAAMAGGKRVLELLARDPAAAVAPVVVVGRRTPAASGLKHGPAAAIPNNLNADEMATRLIALAREIPEREGAVRGDVSPKTIEPLLQSLSEGHRSGVLTVGKDQLPAPARTLLKGGLPVSERPERFVERVKPLLEDSGQPAEYEFQESAVGVDSIPPSRAKDDAPLSMVKGCRVAVVDSDRGRADKLAQALRGRGALAFACVDANGLDQVRGGDPDVVLVDPGDMEGPCCDLMDSFVKDVRLRWASVLAAPRSEVWATGATKPLISAICTKISDLLRPARELSKRLRDHPQFTTRMELLGPARLLRVLAAANKTVRITVRHPKATVHVDVQDGLVCGALAFCKDAPGKPLVGPEALCAMTVMRSGRVTVAPRESAELRELNARVDLALAMVDVENPPIAPSLAPLQQGRFPGQHDRGAPTAGASEGQPQAMGTDGASLSAAGLPAQRRAPAAPAPPVPVSALAQRPDSAAGQIRAKGTMLGLGHAVPRPAGGQAVQAAAVEQVGPSEELDSFRTSIPTLDTALDPLVSEAPSADFEALESQDAVPRSDLQKQTPAASGLAVAARASMQRLAAGLQNLGGMSGDALSRLFLLLVAAKRWLRPAGERLGLLRRSVRIPELESTDAPQPASAEPLAGGPSGSLAFPFAQHRQALGNQLAALIAAIRSRVSPRVLIAVSGCAALSAVLLGAWLFAGAEPQIDVAARETGGAAPVAKVAAPTGAATSAERPPARPEPRLSDSVRAQEAEKTRPSASDAPSGAEPEGPDLPADRAWHRGSARKLVTEATRLRRRQRLGMAEASYLKALSLWPNYPLAMAGVVRVHLERRDGVEALRWAKRLVKMKPLRSNHYLLLGDAYALNAKMDHARKAWRRSARFGNRRAKRRLKGE